MTVRKGDIPLNSRLTAYVTRERGAAELQVSPSTWDEMVKLNLLPKPHLLGPQRNMHFGPWRVTGFVDLDVLDTNGGIIGAITTFAPNSSSERNTSSCSVRRYICSAWHTLAVLPDSAYRTW
jgi:hypothetical protein